MITDSTRSQVTSDLVTLIAAGSAKIGLGGNSTSPAATDLDVPIAGITPTISAIKSDENVIEIKVSVAGSSIAGKVIREVGIFKSDGTLFARNNFTGVGPFSSTETLELFIIWEIE